VLRRLMDVRAASIPSTVLLAVGVLALEVLFVVNYVGGWHDPQPHQVPIDVAGPSLVARPFSEVLDGSGAFASRLVGSERQAREDIDQRRAYAALVVTRPVDRLLVADASGPFAPQVIVQGVTRAEAQAGRPLAVEHVHRTAPGDPRSLTSFYLVVSWVVGGYLLAVLIAVARGMASATPWLGLLRVAGFAAYAVVSGILGAVIVGPVLGALDSNLVWLGLIGMLIVAGSALATAGLESVLGVAGTGLAIVVLVIVGNPSSGGPVEPPLLPTFWRDLNPYTLPGAATTAIRNWAYFDGNATQGALLVMGGYAVIGALLTVLAPLLHRGTR
jgi:hypothetical protein